VAITSMLVNASMISIFIERPNHSKEGCPRSPSSLGLAKY
jgi:hypothetical protein